MIDDFAFPLPITVIAEMLGVTRSDRMMLQRWSREFIAALEFTSQRTIRQP
jgi:cytochrome P450